MRPAAALLLLGAALCALARAAEASDIALPSCEVAACFPRLTKTLRWRRLAGEGPRCTQPSAANPWWALAHVVYLVLKFDLCVGSAWIIPTIITKRQDAQPIIRLESKIHFTG
jgi:hypothetical protein